MHLFHSSHYSIAKSELDHTLLLENSTQQHKGYDMWNVAVYIYYSFSESSGWYLMKIIFNICISDDCRVVASCNKHFRVFVTVLFDISTQAVSLISYISMSFFFHINIPT